MDDTAAPTSRPAPAENASRWGVLRHRHFRNVWYAAFVSSLGGWMEITGVQWAMAQATLTDDWKASQMPTAPVMMAWLAVAQMGPQVVFGLWGGVVADRVNRKTLLLVTQFARMIIAALLCVAAYQGLIHPWVLLVLGAADGVAMAFNIPAWQVLTPRLVPREDLTKAITLNGLQFNLARAIGPALAGLLLSMPGTGVGVLFLLNTISYAFVIGAVATTPDAPAPPQKESHPWLLIREAWSYLLHHKGPLYLILGISVFSMLATPLLRLMPILVKEIYLPVESLKGWSVDTLGSAGIVITDPKSVEAFQEKCYGLLLGTMGLGAVAGALTIRSIPPWYPKHHFVPLSITMCGLAMCAFSAATNIWLAGAAVFVVGIFWMWSFNAAFSALQLLLEDRLRGRVLAIGNTISFGCMPLGAMLAGMLGGALAGMLHRITTTASQTSEGGAKLAQFSSEGQIAQLGLGALSLSLVVVGIVMLIWRTPEIDGLKPGDDGYDRRPGLLRGITASSHRPRQTT